MIKSWSDAAWKDFEYWIKQDKKTLTGTGICNLTNLHNLGNVNISNCSYNRLQQEEKSMEWIAAMQRAIIYSK